MNDKILNKNEADNCKIVEELLSAFFDEELNETADGAVRRHLDECKACAVKLEELKATVETINSLPAEATPESDLWPGISAATGGGEQRRRKFPIPVLIAAALAGLMVPGALAVGAFTLFRSHDTSTGVLADAPAPSSIPDIPALPDVPAPPVPRADLPPDRSLAMLQALIRSLSDSDADVRRTAAMALGNMSDRSGEAAGALARVLRTDDVAEVRRWAAWALGEIGNGTSVDPLLTALQTDESNQVRRWAAWALGELGDPRAVGVLTSAVLNDSWAEARRWSAWALGEIASPAAVPGLSTALLQDPVVEVRRWSAWALGEIADPRATDALARAVDDESAEVRRWAVWALAEIGN